MPPFSWSGRSEGSRKNEQDGDQSVPWIGEEVRRLVIIPVVPVLLGHNRP